MSSPEKSSYFTEKPQVTISLLGSLPDGGKLYHYKTDNGTLSAHHKLSGEYRIDRIDVNTTERRRGIGKELLRQTTTHASEVGASFMTAAIVSRACLNAMQTVFGKENITVANEGDYDIDNTRAYLIIDVDNPVEPSPASPQAA